MRRIRKNGAPGTIRTSDPQIRSLMLYPAELRARLAANGEGGSLADGERGSKTRAAAFVRRFRHPGVSSRRRAGQAGGLPAVIVSGPSMRLRLPPFRSPRPRPLTALVLGAAVALAGCAGGPARGPGATPAAEAAPLARGPFVAAANPLAVEAGLAVLRRGGSAADAAVAVQAVLGLVEPQSSGLGGGAFLMHCDAGTGEVTGYDGRETAPAGAAPELFYEDGRPLPFREAVLSGRSTGAPGAVALLARVQAEHGRLPWSELFDAAGRLARDGFVVSPRLAGMIAGRSGQAATPWATRYFTKPDGTRYAAGDLLRNPAYADTVAEIAAGGA